MKREEAFAHESSSPSAATSSAGEGSPRTPNETSSDMEQKVKG